jgi:hypothetical protein
MGLGVSGPSGPRKVDTGPQRVSSAGGVEKPFAVEESQGVNRSVGAIPISEAEKVSQTSSTKPVDTVKAPTPQKPFSRPVSESDIVDLLIQLRKPPTAENKNILSTILQFGLEASQENLDTVSRLVQTRNQFNVVESAVVSHLKGVSDSSKSVDILSAFLSNQNQMGQIMDKMQLSMQRFQSNFQQFQVLLNPALFSGLASIISQMDDSLKKWIQNASESTSSQFLRSGIVQDLRLFSDFLGGIPNTLAADENPALFALFKQQSQLVRSQISKFLESVVSQSIISKESYSAPLGTDQFAYWQIPNPFSETKKSIDILIKKDPQNKKRKFNPQKTKFIVKFETEDIGELAISVELSEKKVWYVFYTDNPQTKDSILRLSPDLKLKMASLNYEVVGMQLTPKRLDIKKLLLPTINLDKISRVSSEA